MLNKEICIKCINKNRTFSDGTTLSWTWNEKGDEQRWKDKYIYCPKSAYPLNYDYDTYRRDINTIPLLCLYRLEHILKETEC